MALVGGIIPPPDWIPSSSPNTRQTLHQNRTFGMFFHYGPGTFSNQEWTDPATFTPADYAPTQTPDPSQWATVAKNGGATYIIGICKHHDGFTMWNSSDTSYGINSTGSGNTTDVIAALATACRTQGIKLALYYSLWDRTRNADTSNTSLDAAYNATVITHLTELFTNYGQICELWLDGGWEKLPSRWNLAAIYKLFREKQPLGVLMTNQTIGNPNTVGKNDGFGIQPTSQVAGDPVKYPPSDFRSWDTQYTRSGTPGTGGTSNADPKTFLSSSQTYYMPIETPITINTGDQWFWHDATTDSNFQTVAYLTGAYYHSTGQRNTFVLNIPPNKAAQISSACQTQFSAVTNAMGMTAGCAVVDKAEGKTCTASTEFSATYAANKVATGQILGGPRWAAADGDTTNPFIYIDLGSAQSISRVALKEWYDASSNPTTRLTAFSVQTSNDASSWTTRTSGAGTTTAADETGATSFKWVVCSFSAVSARYVRLLFTSVTNPPTLNAVRVF